MTNQMPQRSDETKMVLTLSSWNRERMVACLFVCTLLIGCGRPTPADRFVRPSEIKNFEVLFANNCSGCHGKAGNLGPAPPLNDPLFQAIVSDDELRQLISAGRTKTLMPAFEHGHIGSLTAEQVQILVAGMRENWKKPLDPPLENIPPYVDEGSDLLSTSSDVEAGKKLFALVCASCHGPEGSGGMFAGPLNVPAMLALTSDQTLRRIIITGRPDLGMPNFAALGEKSELKRALTSDEITQLVHYVRSWEKSPADSPQLSSVSPDSHRLGQEVPR